MPAPGRNDPCPCGSGKKYKNCHLALDRDAAGARAEAERARQARLEALGHPSDAEMRELYAETTGRTLPPGPISDQARTSIVDLWRQRKLNDQALASLAPQRKRWDKHFQAHPDEFDAVARGLGRDAFFDHYVLTNANRRKVRVKLGAPPRDDPVALRTYAGAAIALALDDEDRGNFKDALLSRLPDLVEAGAYKEATVVATCAERVLDPDAPISPFLESVVTRSVKA